MSVTLADIQAARRTLRDVIIATPILPAERLTQDLGARIYFKAECTQRSGSFKIRGAYNKISRLAPDERARGVIAHSAGNHAQGVAMAARLLDPPATIVMPERAPLTKVAATRRLGAQVILYGQTFDYAGAYAAQIKDERGLTYVHAFDDERVIAGQGTIGLELVEALPELALVVEGAGAAGVAALLSGKIVPRPDETVCVILSGGNIDGNLLARVIEQVLVKQGRYILLRTTVDDRPGNLAPLIDHVARAGANVIDIFHRRAVWLVPVDRVGIEMVLEVRDEAHGQEVVRHLAAAGYHVEREGQGLWPG